MLRLQDFQGREIEAHLDKLGELRIAIFRDYPYLYEGTLAYERDYLRTYLNSEGSLVVLVFDGEAVVGATTCLPMRDEGPEFQRAFLDTGHDLNGICYFGESLLLPNYRGQGLGREYFVRREAHARRLGFDLTTFCAVDRPAEHPLRPPQYRPLDPFWTSLGYTKRPELRATFEWKEIGEEVESPKTLTYWTKEWTRT